ncbi:hypothetical protein [Janibacter melonis]|uniref:hypothetical protein n=1 Tax=Janibacter melonis TaxID=262209 RepID=UPI0020953FDF|nr:hypothetical protein [Janibacter melonis]
MTFALVPSAQGGTDVTWTMRGMRGVAGQVFAKVLRLGDKLGGDFERGLVQLGALAEGGRRVSAPGGGSGNRPLRRGGR